MKNETEKQEEQNTLPTLNDLLFDTVRQVKEGKMDAKNAGVIAQLSTTIINNVKVQLQAHKAFKRGDAPVQLGISAEPKQEPDYNKVLEASKKKNHIMTLEEKSRIKDKHEGMLHCAREYGYKSVADAISREGKREFDEIYKTWLKE